MDIFSTILGLGGFLARKQSLENQKKDQEVTLSTWNFLLSLQDCEIGWAT